MGAGLILTALGLLALHAGVGLGSGVVVVGLLLVVISFFTS